MKQELIYWLLLISIVLIVTGTAWLLGWYWWRSLIMGLAAVLYIYLGPHHAKRQP